MSLKDIVNVKITRATKVTSRVGFGVTNVFGLSKAFTPLIKEYANVSDAGVDFKTTDPEYIAVSDAFAQNPAPAKVAVSRRASADLSVLTVVTAGVGLVYKTIIDGIEIVTTAVGATAILIAGEIVSDINGAVGVVVNAVDNLDGTIDLTPDVATTPYSIKADDKCSFVVTSSGTISADLDAINQENSEWYGLVFTSRVATDVKAVMDWTESQVKFFVTASDDANIADLTDSGDTVSIAYYNKSQSLARSMVFYHKQASSEFLDAGMLGRALPLDPGSYIFAMKTIKSVTVNNLTETQQSNIKAKNANFYQSVGGVNTTLDGKVGEGEFADTIVFVDWLTARMTERIFTTLVNNDKVPYSDGGITAIQADVIAQLQDGITSGGLLADPAPTVTVPLRSETSVADRGARTLNNVNFSATLAGAIQSVTVDGVVSL